jgi:hypothetical protein
LIRLDLTTLSVEFLKVAGFNGPYCAAETPLIAPGSDNALAASERAVEEWLPGHT